MAKSVNQDLVLAKAAIVKRRSAEEKAETLRLKVTDILERRLEDIDEDLDKMTAQQRWNTLLGLAPYAMRKLQVADASIKKAVDDEEDELTKLAKQKAKLKEEVAQINATYNN
jgi:hypothetical protein